MAYREDRDADQARIAALEAELTTARSKIDRLEGKQSQALVLATPVALAGTDGASQKSATRWFGAPTRLELARKFDGAFPVDKLEDLVDTIREHTRDRGRVELLRSSVAWSASTNDRGIGPFTNVTVSTKDGATSLVVTDRLSQLAGGIFGGIGGGVGGGLLVAPIFAALALGPVAVPFIAVGWLGGCYGLTRRIYKGAAKKRAIALQQLFDVVAAEIEKTLRA